MSSKFAFLDTRLVQPDNATISWRDLSFAVQILLPFALAALIFSKKLSVPPFTSYASVFWPTVNQKRHLTKWLYARIPYVNGTSSNKISQFWKDGSLLCTLINTVIPGACPNPQRHWKQSPVHGQALVWKYFGIEPALNSSDFTENRLSLSSERKFINYLTALEETISKVAIDPEKLTFTNKYIARGMGLIVGEQGKFSTFYLYPNSDAKSLDNVYISIKGPYGSYGKLMITSEEMSKNVRKLIKEKKRNDSERGKLEFKSRTQNSFFKPISLEIMKYLSNDMKSGDIFVDVEMETDRAKITFLPEYSGIYELLLVTNDEHIHGSPFVIRVTKKSKDEKKEILSKTVDFIDASDLNEDNKVFLKIDQNNNQKEKIEAMEIILLKENEENARKIISIENHEETNKENKNVEYIKNVENIDNIKNENKEIFEDSETVLNGNYNFDEDKEFEKIYSDNLSESDESSSKFESTSSNFNEKNEDEENRENEEKHIFEVKESREYEKKCIDEDKENQENEEKRKDEECKDNDLNEEKEVILNIEENAEQFEFVEPSRPPEDYKLKIYLDEILKELPEEKTREQFELIDEIEEKDESFGDAATSTISEDIVREVLEPKDVKKTDSDSDFRPIENQISPEEDSSAPRVFEIKLKFERQIQETSRHRDSAVVKLKESQLDFTRSMPDLATVKDDYEKVKFLPEDDKTNEFLVQFQEKKKFWDSLVESGSSVSLSSNCSDSPKVKPQIKTAMSLINITKSCEDSIKIENLKNEGKILDKIKIFEKDFNSEKHLTMLNKTKRKSLKSIPSFRSIKSSEGLRNLHQNKSFDEGHDFEEGSRRRFEDAKHFFRSIERLNNNSNSNNNSRTPKSLTNSQRSVSLRSLNVQERFHLDNLYRDVVFNKFANGSLRGSPNRDGIAGTLASISSTESGLEKDFNDQEDLDLEVFRVSRKMRRRKSVKSLFEINY